MTQSPEVQGQEQADPPVEPSSPPSEASEVREATASNEPSPERVEHEPDEPAEADPSEADASEADEEDAAEAGEGVEAGEGEGKPKKKRRRRRKKKKTEEGEAAAAPEGAPPPRKKDTSHLPFQRLFDASGGRRHAFAVGEIVAGRVLSVAGDVGVVDLFGKARAFARATEPRDIPIEPVAHEPEVEAPAEASPMEAVPEGDALAEASAAPAEASAPEHHEVGHPAGEHEVHEAGQHEAGHHEAGHHEAGHHEAGHHEAGHHEDDDAEEPAMPAGVELDYQLRTEAAPITTGEIFRGRVGAVAESGHIALVNQPIDPAKARTFLAHARDARVRVDGLVFGFNRGGFDVLVGGLRAFCPVGGLSLDVVDDPETLLGQWAQFHVQQAKPGSQGLVVSRRSILEKDARKRARQLLKSLQPGQRITGRVTQVREFGLFVDLGGVEGLVHQSELSWDRGVKPSDVAKVGDEIEVQIREVHEPQSRRERHERISLTLKALAPDPWDAHADLLVEGVPRRGTVVRTAEFGAFVQLAPGIDGLLHVSELGKDLKHAREAPRHLRSTLGAARTAAPIGRLTQW